MLKLPASSRRRTLLALLAARAPWSWQVPCGLRTHRTPRRPPATNLMQEPLRTAAREGTDVSEHGQRGRPAPVGAR
jgi:hypothetical protein